MKRRGQVFVALTAGLSVVILAAYVRFDVTLNTATGQDARQSVLFDKAPTTDRVVGNKKPSTDQDQFLYVAETNTEKLVAELPLNDSVDLEQLGFPITNFSVGSNDQFVFVTAASDGFLHVAMDAIARIQTHFPNHAIYYYDLGHSTDQTRQKITELCNVFYREFNFSRYPDHVTNLHTYAFKPLIIHELLREHSNIFWVDSSIRFKTGDLSSAEQQASNESRGIVFFDDSGHSIFAATHETTFRYLPMNKENAAKVEMWGANAIYLRCSSEMYDHVIRWWFLCALKRDCMAPTTDLYCQFNGRDQYAHCHRYDQSVINILLANYFDNNEKLYFAKAPVLDVARGSRDLELIHVCAPAAPPVRTKSKEYFS